MIEGIADDNALPDDLQGLTCGAKTRAGTSCKRTDLWENFAGRTLEQMQIGGVKQ